MIIAPEWLNRRCSVQVEGISESKGRVVGFYTGTFPMALIVFDSVPKKLISVVLSDVTFLSELRND